jgi:hypothetical protein
VRINITINIEGESIMATINDIKAELAQILMGVQNLQSQIAALKAAGTGASQEDIDALDTLAKNIIAVEGSSVPVIPPTGEV